MTNLGYYNGKYGPLEEMTIPMNDRVSYFGDGVYDATYTANHVIFALDEHVDRLFRSMEMIRIQPDKTKEEVKELLKDMVRKVDSPDQFVYIQVTRGTAPRAHVFPRKHKTQLVDHPYTRKALRCEPADLLYHKGRHKVFSLQYKNPQPSAQCSCGSGS